MEPLQITTLVGAAIAFLWAGYERFSKIRAVDGGYVADLASAAHSLVETYRGQVIELTEEMKSLECRLDHLEQKLEFYENCPRKDCPIRELLAVSENN